MNIPYFICSVPTQNEIRLRRREELLHRVLDAPPSSINFNPLAAESIFLQTLDEAKKCLSNFGYSIQVIKHSCIWMYHPQTNKYFPIGDWKNGEFLQYKDVIHFNKAGEVGVNLSFANAMRAFLATEEEFVLWLEDDAELTQDWKSQIELLLGNLPDCWDVINLAEGPSRSESSLLDYRTQCWGLMLNYHPYQSHCVLISRSGALKFLEFLSFWGSVLPLDWILFNVRSPEVRDVDPFYFVTFAIDPQKYRICPWSLHYVDKTLTTILIDDK